MPVLENPHDSKSVGQWRTSVLEWYIRRELVGFVQPQLYSRLPEDLQIATVRVLRAIDGVFRTLYLQRLKDASVFRSTKSEQGPDAIVRAVLAGALEVLSQENVSSVSGASLSFREG